MMAKFIESQHATFRNLVADILKKAVMPLNNPRVRYIFYLINESVFKNLNTTQVLGSENPGGITGSWTEAKATDRENLD